MSESPPLIERLAWDSAFFGFGIGRVTANRMTIGQGTRCAGAARELGMRCVYFLADSDEPETWRAAIQAGFDPIDIRVELERPVSQVEPSHRQGSTLASERDLPELLELARGAFTQSRFFRDGRFPAGKAEELFSTWVGRSVRAQDRFVLLHRSAERPAGFVSVRLASPESAQIELVAVSPALRGKGVATSLLHATSAELATRSARRVAVVTQGSNAAAQRLYERAGFRTRSVRLWFHGWF